MELCLPVVIFDRQGIVAIFVRSLSDQELPLSPVLQQREREKHCKLWSIQYMRERPKYVDLRFTVEPINKGHFRDQSLCPLWRGCPLSEVIFYRVCKLSACPLLGGLSSFGASFI